MVPSARVTLFASQFLLCRRSFSLIGCILYSVTTLLSGIFSCAHGFIHEVFSLINKVRQWLRMSRLLHEILAGSLPEAGASRIPATAPRAAPATKAIRVFWDDIDDVFFRCSLLSRQKLYQCHVNDWNPLRSKLRPQWGNVIPTLELWNPSRCEDGSPRFLQRIRSAVCRISCDNGSHAVMVRDPHGIQKPRTMATSTSRPASTHVWNARTPVNTAPPACLTRPMWP